MTAHRGVEVSNRLAAEGIAYGQREEATPAHPHVVALVEQLRTLGPAELVAALVVLGRRDEETDPHGIAVELAAVVITRDPVLDNYTAGRWHRQNVIRGVRELDRLRYPPTGDRDLWVRYGPLGPPPCVAVKPEAAA